MYARLATLKNCRPLFHKLKVYFKDGVFIFLAIIPHAKLRYSKKKKTIIPCLGKQLVLLSSHLVDSLDLGSENIEILRKTKLTVFLRASNSE